jgi:hypothetical protein
MRNEQVRRLTERFHLAHRRFIHFDCAVDDQVSRRTLRDRHHALHSEVRQVPLHAPQIFGELLNWLVRKNFVGAHCQHAMRKAFLVERTHKRASSGTCVITKSPH